MYVDSYKLNIWIKIRRKTYLDKLSRQNGDSARDDKKKHMIRTQK